MYLILLQLLKNIIQFVYIYQATKTAILYCFNIVIEFVAVKGPHIS